MKRSRIWRAGIFLSVVVMMFSMTVGQMLEINQNMVNNYLGTKTYRIEVSDSGNLYTTFVSDYATTDDLVAAHKALGARISEEGTVLLKNNGALPMETGAVTLLGVPADAKTYYGARVGVSVTASQNVSLTTALQEIGFQVNETINDAYKGLVSGKTYKKAFQNANKLESNFGGVVPGAEKPYIPLEMKAEDLASQAPDYLDTFARYHDAAIVMFSRASTEGADFFAGEVGIDPASGARNPLALTNDERALLSMAKENFDKVIVLLNTANPMEIEELKQDDGVDAILWIGMPGNYGMRGVAAILSGAVNPSGALTDIYATNSVSAPAMANTGLFNFSNAAGKLDTAVHRGDYYLIEAEGIYTGYRYYETRYADSVMGQGNASSEVGTFDSKGAWTYAEEVSYPFGFGMSYTTFSRTLDSIDVSVENKTITAQVTVTNTGAVPGKTSVQLYGQAPYIAGGVEKSAIQLVGFEKTDVLAPSESCQVTVTSDLEYIASYDESIGKYILDGGDYYFAVGSDSHEALNSILAQQGYTADNGMDGTGIAGSAAMWQYAPDGGRDITTFAVTEAGAEVSNKLQAADFNTWVPGTVTYLSRSDWAATWPKPYRDLSFPDAMLPYLANDFYTIAKNDDVSGFVFGANNGLTFADMKDVAYDDPMWDQLIDQMTLQEQALYVTIGNVIYSAVDSIQFAGGALAQDAPNGFHEKLSANTDENSPWYVSADDPNAEYQVGDMGCGTLIGATFNKQLLHDIGLLIGNDGLYVGLSINWGPGLNLHRSPYNGRNGEYFSEDPVLSGLLAVAESEAAISKGVITAVKHFAFNDQETNRNGVAPFMNEQKARELELRAFQIAFEHGTLGTMTAFNRIGATYVSACKELITGILKDEWGFRGYIVTDMINPASYMTWKESVMAGTTNFDTVAPQPAWEEYLTNETNAIGGDAALLTAMRENIHQSLYAFAQTNLMNVSGSSVTKIEVNNWWRIAYKSTTYGFAAIAVLCLIGYVAALLRSGRKENRNEK